jgi:hypothetical protein
MIWCSDSWIGDEVAEFVRLRDLAFADGRGVRLEETQDLVRHMRVPTQQARARLVYDSLDHRPQGLQLGASAVEDRRRALRGGAPALRDPSDHRVRVPQNGARRGRQLPVALDQGVPRLRRPRLIADRQNPLCHAAQPIPHASRLVAQRRTRPLHRAGQHSYAVLQQGAVGRIVPWLL